MVIESSRVYMESARTYAKTTSVSAGKWGSAYQSAAIGEKDAHYEVETYQNYSANGRLLQSWGYNPAEGNALQEEKSKVGKSNEKDMMQNVQDQTLDAIMTRVLGSRRKRILTLREFLDELIQNRREAIRELMKLSSGTGTVKAVAAVRREVTYEHVEQENTSYHSKGRVTTTDGRTISFDVEVEMSRRFEEHTKEMQLIPAADLTDPLVINMNCDSVSFRNQKFLFDIDADGTLDSISMLSQMCGYLALDKNGDGKINDGSELFGAKTGDGFAELAVYDTDGNGWIDENDDVFDKLRIWSKDASGNDVLVGLGVKGVGAIYLGSVPTQFEVKNRENETQAVVRQSGVFIKEDGSVGTVQQVDMAS